MQGGGGCRHDPLVGYVVSFREIAEQAERSGGYASYDSAVALAFCDLLDAVRHPALQLKEPSYPKWRAWTKLRDARQRLNELEAEGKEHELAV